MEHTARRLHRLVEPIHLVTHSSDEPTEALMALGHRNYWDGYFAGRAAPLGRGPASEAVFEGIGASPPWLSRMNEQTLAATREQLDAGGPRRGVGGGRDNDGR